MQDLQYISAIVLWLIFKFKNLKYTLLIDWFDWLHDFSDDILKLWQ